MATALQDGDGGVGASAVISGGAAGNAERLAEAGVLNLSFRPTAGSMVEKRTTTE